MLLSACAGADILFSCTALACRRFDPLPSCALGRFTCPCCSVMHASSLPQRVVRFKIVLLEIHGSLGSNPACLGRGSLASRVVLSERSLAHTAWPARACLLDEGSARVGGFLALTQPAGRAHPRHSQHRASASPLPRPHRRCNGKLAAD